ncbi:MAG: hypothetical protein WDN24_10610 [Sphingomonas sp.]
MVAVTFVIVSAIVIGAGLVGGAAWAMRSYGRVFMDTIGPEPLPAPPFDPGREPAVRGYFFGKGYRDLRELLRASFETNHGKAEVEWNEGERDLAPSFKNLEATYKVAFAAGIAVFGAIFTLSLTAAYALILTAATAVVYLAFVLLRSFEQIFMFARGYILVCPRCHTRLPLPVYLCGSCGAQHRALYPSVYGVFRRRCRCGARLPATMVMNRGALKSLCHNCDYVLSRAHTEAPKTCIPIIGATSVGKTAFAFALCRELVEAAPRLGLESEFLSPEANRAYTAGAAAMLRGRAPDKTMDQVPHALDLLFKRDGNPHRLLYLYDPAGEAFTDRNYLAQHRFLSYPDGILLMLDPFAFGPVARGFGAAVLTEVRASGEDPQGVTAGLLNILETEFALGAKQRSAVPLAVIVNKIDAAGIESMIGSDAIARSMNPGEQLEDARNRLIREHLLRWEQTPLVDQLETRFKRIGYFAVSSLGRSEDTTSRPLQPRAVLEPFSWLLERSGGNWMKGG